MQSIIFLIAFLFLIYFVVEKINNDKRRRKIKYVIHVNGTRGKSTVSRLIDAGLREGNLRVFTKTTGTSPRIINTFNVEKEILRKGKANIREQIKAIKWAYKEKAEVLILECMAVNPEFQKISEDKILNADIGVITNVREDHLDEMGNNLEEIANSLANMIPQNGKVFTADERFFNFFLEKALKKNSQAILSNNLKKQYEKVDFPDNVALALDVCAALGVSNEVALKGMEKYKKDSGVLKVFKKQLNDHILYFVNAMAANDPTSTGIILNKIKKEFFWNNKKIILLNNRKDRLSRGEQHAKFIKEVEADFDKIIIFGENKELLKKLLLKEDIDERKIRLENNKKFFEVIKDDSFIFAIGNICGKGKELIDFFEMEGES